MDHAQRRPRAIRLLAETSRQPVTDKIASGKAAARRPRAAGLKHGEMARLELLPDHAVDPGEVGEAPVPPRRARGYSLAGVLLGSVSGLGALALGVWLEGFVRGLFARADWLGWSATALAASAGIALLAIVARELAALLRLRNIGRLRDRFASAHAANDSRQAKAATAELARMFAARPQAARGRAALAAHEGEILDGADLVELAEREILAPADAEATLIALASAKRVSVVTAISPRALLDVFFVLFETLRLISRIATLYGGRPGSIGTMRLVGRVTTHLAATGAIAAGDSLLQQILGHGLAARVSAKLGEGLLNGLLTARVGIAAIEVCRPMPFLASKRPGLSDFVAALAPSLTSATKRQAGRSDLDRDDPNAR